MIIDPKEAKELGEAINKMGIDYFIKDHHFFDVIPKKYEKA